VDGYRRYADEPEQPSWIPGLNPATGPAEHPAPASPYDSGVYERPSPSAAFRLPEQRPAESYDEVTSTGSHARPTTDPQPPRTPVRGPEYPAVRPTSAASFADGPRLGETAPHNAPTSLVPPVAAPERGREAVYHTRRPVSAVIMAIVTVLLMVPVVRLLVDATFAGDPVARSIVPAVLLTLGLPLTGSGLFALAGGGRLQDRDTWLRPPVAYLPTGLLLVLAAALAVA
jgi:hypothetical protein